MISNPNLMFLDEIIQNYPKNSNRRQRNNIYKKVEDFIRKLNEQVFLSAEPDHWCHVPELVNYSQTYSNLSLGHIKRLAIPRVDLGADRHDVVMYEKCFQYDVNFTDVYVKHGHKWPKRADPTWDRVPCKDGWDFDHSEYKDTLVTEVRNRKYLFVNISIKQREWRG